MHLYKNSLASFTIFSEMLEMVSLFHISEITKNRIISLFLENISRDFAEIIYFSKKEKQKKEKVD